MPTKEDFSPFEDHFESINVDSPPQNYYFDCIEGFGFHNSPICFKQHSNLDSSKPQSNNVAPYWSLAYGHANIHNNWN
jgi:hypothetical protein